MEQTPLEKLAYTWSAAQSARAHALCETALEKLPGKIIVLDDDPTGVQTVHGISVFTDWSQNSIDEGFLENSRMFFILTNSRAMTTQQTARVHREIAERILISSNKFGIPFILISRSDSTLRGHFPLETDTLRQTIESQSALQFDGEIICPFFMEGGRFTIDDIHYVKEGSRLVPSAETEFSKDATFSYTHSNLKDWVEEKTRGVFPASSVISIPLDVLRECNAERVAQLLTQAKGFGKIIVNATSYEDIQVFAAGFFQACLSGKRYLLRTAAAVPKVLGGIADKALLEREDFGLNGPMGGLIIVGSHVNKTTAQLHHLLNARPDLQAYEFDVSKVLDSSTLQQALNQLSTAVSASIRAGQTALVYTSRERLALKGDKEAQLLFSVRVSQALTSLVSQLNIKPAFIIAKGGITSSDIGVLGLGVKKALVLGQILPGVPVWLTDEGSRFGQVPYIIFPGNVGQDDALTQAVNKLTG